MTGMLIATRVNYLSVRQICLYENPLPGASFPARWQSSAKGALKGRWNG
jgi:hypothetical protein